MQNRFYPMRQRELRRELDALLFDSGCLRERHGLSLKYVKSQFRTRGMPYDFESWFTGRDRPRGRRGGLSRILLKKIRDFIESHDELMKERAEQAAHAEADNRHGYLVDPLDVLEI